MVVYNTAVCAIAMAIGAYTFVKHLNGFSQNKQTPAVNAWLVAVGTMGWSVWLYASLNDTNLTGVKALGVTLNFVFWAGMLLQIQKYCARLLRQRLKKKATTP